MLFNGFQRAIQETKGNIVIKSIQRITGSMVFPTTSQAHTINAVDTSKTFLIVSNASTNGDSASGLILLTLTNSTTVTASRVGNNAGTSEYDVQVVEIFGLKSLQSGSVTFGTTSTTVSINAVNTSKSMLFLSANCGSGINTFSNALTRGNITNSTTLTFSQSTSAGATRTVNWFVVELP